MNIKYNMFPAIAGGLFMISNTYADNGDYTTTKQTKTRTVQKTETWNDRYDVSQEGDNWNFFVFGDALLLMADEDNLNPAIKRGTGFVPADDCHAATAAGCVEPGDNPTMANCGCDQALDMDGPDAPCNSCDWSKPPIALPNHCSRGERMDFELNWGFRVGIGATIAHDRWIPMLSWFHIRNTAHEKDPGDEDCKECQEERNLPCGACPPPCCPTHVFFPTWATPIGCGSCTPCNVPNNCGDLHDEINAIPDKNFWVSDVQATWKSQIDMVDLTLGREIAAARWLALTPYAGIRSAWVKQVMKVKMTGGKLDSLAGVDRTRGTIDKVRMRSYFWGIGPEFGLVMNFGIGWGFSVNLNGTVALVHGYFKTSKSEQQVMLTTIPSSNPCCKEEEESCTPGCFDTLIDFRDHFRATRAITDITLGLAWKKTFSKDRYEVGFHVNWEQHLFFQQNAFPRFNFFNEEGVHSGDLGLTGLSFGGWLAF